MTPIDQPENPVDRSTFAGLLERLVSQARDADVALEGAYNVRTPLPDRPDYTIEITELAKNRLGGKNADTDE